MAASAVALAGLAATVIGQATDDGPGNTPVPGDVRALDSHPVAGPPGKRGFEGQIVYRETERLGPIATGPGGAIVEKCPRGSIAINGYYYQEVYNQTNGEWEGVFDGFGLDDQGSSPAGWRRWAFYWDNVAGKPIEGVRLGLICDKDG